jgi:hypothetical protein
VPFHPHFKMLLPISDDVDLIRQFTGNSVNDYRHSAIVPILTLAWSSTGTSSAVVLVRQRSYVLFRRPSAF